MQYKAYIVVGFQLFASFLVFIARVAQPFYVQWTSVVDSVTLSVASFHCRWKKTERFATV